MCFLWVGTHYKVQITLSRLFGKKSRRNNLLEQLANFPVGFPIDFACGELTRKVANDDYMTIVSLL